MFFFISMCEILMEKKKKKDELLGSHRIIESEKGSKKLLMQLDRLA